MKIAFIGGWGHPYLRGLPGNPAMRIEPAAAGDGHDAEAARKWALSNKVERWFDDPIECLDVFQPDMVSVGAVYAYNGDLVAEAISRDLPVVSDKPIATSAAQLDRLEDLARGTSRVVLTEFDFRANSSFRAARRAVADGKIGVPILATAQKSYRFGTRPAWYADRAAYGGTLLWVASHAIDVIPFVTGRTFKRAIGAAGNLSQPGFGSMEDHVSILFELDNGGSAIAHADYLRPAAAPTHGDDRLRVAGSLGVVEVREGRCMLMTRTSDPRDITDSVSVRPVAEELMAAARGETTEFYSTEKSLATARTLLLAREAADSRKWIAL